MISPKKITEQKLCDMLIEKHRKFLENYKREFDIRHRLIVLREKKDQLEHWLKDSEDDAKKHRVYAKRLKVTNQNVLKLEKELEKFQNALDEKERYKTLKKKIDMHSKALNYWTEFKNSKKKVNKNERKGTKEKDK